MSERVQIVVPGDNPIQIAGSPHLQRLAPYGDVTLFEDTPQSADEKIARAEGAQIIINTRGVVTWREEMRRLPALKMIATCSIGTDMIDLAIAKELGIVVSNQPGRTAPVVAEHMFGLMFALSKRAYFQTAELKAGRWTREMNTMLQGKVLGVVGTGPIGAEMARLGRAIGMEVIAWTFNPSPERAAEYGVRFVELDELLQTADVVSLHVKLTEDTRHFLGAREFGLMKEGALVLNGARGDVLDMNALRDALLSGHVGRGRAGRIPRGAAAERRSHPRLRSGGVDASCGGSDARGGGFVERGCGGQCDCVFGGTAAEQCGAVR